MRRVLIIAAFVLTCGLGCGDKSSSGQPKLSNPDDPKLKAMKPASPNSGAVSKGQQSSVAQ